MTIGPLLKFHYQMMIKKTAISKSGKERVTYWREFDTRMERSAVVLCAKLRRDVIERGENQKVSGMTIRAGHDTGAVALTYDVTSKGSKISVPGRVKKQEASASVKPPAKRQTPAKPGPRKPSESDRMPHFNIYQYCTVPPYRRKSRPLFTGDI